MSNSCNTYSRSVRLFYSIFSVFTFILHSSSDFFFFLLSSFDLNENTEDSSMKRNKSQNGKEIENAAHIELFNKKNQANGSNFN